MAGGSRGAHIQAVCATNLRAVAAIPILSIMNETATAGRGVVAFWG